MSERTLGEMIIFYRNKANLMQKELAEKVGITPTALNYYEKDKREPGVIIIKRLAKALGVTGDDLLGTNESKQQSSVTDFDNVQPLSPPARRIGGLYDKADNHARDIVELTLKPFDDGKPVPQRAESNILDFPSPTRPMPLHILPASAGSGVFLDSDDFEMVDVGSEVPLSAHFGVYISGDSMEPKFPNGHIAWVSMSPAVDVGQVGVFMLNGDGYIKKMGHGELISLNKAYKPIPLREQDDFRIYGRVVAVTDDVR